jgi:hypothetical protein
MSLECGVIAWDDEPAAQPGESNVGIMVKWPEDTAARFSGHTLGK